MTNITRERARGIISEIYAQSGGFLGASEQEKALGDVLGASVRDAAAKACTNDTRFFHEMIQNADDCSYNRANSLGNKPFLKFIFEPGRIVVQSNEDGFEESHVRALCSAGKNTKTGQIGEKGIGFKSLFKVAWKVQVQSGPFCFSLQHRQGQNGLGMIAPINEVHECLPSGLRTCFTLFLIDPGQYLDLNAKFQDFPLTTVAFLRKVTVVKAWYQKSFFAFQKLPADNGFYVRLSQDHNTKRDLKCFLFTKQVTDLPSRESRPSPSVADVTLAFPLDGELPSAVTQAGPFAHAYLPLSGAGSGSRFLIQSDFVTQDNRQDLAVCPWNDHLLAELPGVFYAALEALCSMQQFEYTWPRFLPVGDIKHAQWAPFQESVKRDLKHLRIFKTARGTLKTLEEVLYLLPEHCDANGYPLFSDSEDIYLSIGYNKYYEILKIFGLEPVSSRQLLDRLRRHLVSIPFGKPNFGRHLDDIWYSRVASLVLSWMDSPLAKEVEVLRIVPVFQKSLFDSTQVLEVLKSPKEADIYFPHDTCGKLIPDSVLDTVPVSNAGNATQKQLFTRLGVKLASQSLVLQRIYDWNARKLLPPNVDQSVLNLWYMFHATADRSMIKTECILVYDEAGKALRNPRRFSADVYFKTNDRHGMSEICQLFQRQEVARWLPPLHVRFLHPSYTADLRTGTAWEKWLEETCSIQRAPRLESPDSPGQPSNILRHIVTLAPDKLIGILKVHSDTYERELTNISPATSSYIKAALVPTECGNAALNKTFLGTPQLREIWSDANLKHRFPFLLIPFEWADADTVNWGFLSQFGVTTTLSTEYLLESVSRLCQVSPIQYAKDGFFRLYAILAEHPFEEFWDRVSGIDLIYIKPLFEPARIVRITNCIWDGPKWSTKYDVARLDDYSSNIKVKQLFQRVLSTQKPDWEGSLLELSRLEKDGIPVTYSPIDIYNYLVTGSQTQPDWDTIRDRFALNDIIYIPDENTWCASTECVWSASPFAERQYGIRHLYPDLKELFVKRLGVHSPDVRDYVYEIELAAFVGDITTSQMLVLIQELSGLNPTAHELGCLELVSFLPVRHGGTHTIYLSASEPFLIVDDERFQVDPEVPVLSMTPEEVCRSRAFIAAMGLETRCVSRQLIESTHLVDDAEESVDLTNALRGKAAFLYRCALHHGSPKATLSKDRAEQLFSRATVYTATGFWRYFSLENGLAAQVSHEGLVHFEEVDNTLRIYVPRDPRQRAICYATALPRALVRNLNIHDKTACETFATVLRESIDILDEILTDRGVIKLPTALPQPQGLAIRTKSKLEFGKKKLDSTTTSTFTSTRQSTPIMLKASEWYLKEQNKSLSYLTTLTKKYGIADVDIYTNPLFGYLHSKQENRGRTTLEAALDLAAQSFEPNQMSLLLGNPEIGDQVTITDSALERAVQNEVCGGDIVKCLIEYMRLSGQDFPITATLLEAAVENAGCGPQILPMFLEYVRDEKGDTPIITEDVLKAAAENTESGAALVSIILKQQNINATITEDVLIAAAENEGQGYQILNRLLDHDGHVRISLPVFKAAAGNLQQGLNIMSLILQHNWESIPVTEDIVISAIHNDTAGPDILNLLKEYNGDCLHVTENVLVAAAESELCHKVLDLLDLSREPRITRAVIEAAARSPNCGKEYLGRLLDLKGSDIQVTEEALLGAVHDSEKVKLLLKHRGHLSEAVLIAAASSVEWCLERTLLDLLLAHGLRITDAVLVAAARNPVHAIPVVPLLLELDKEIHISEDAIFAAVTNCASSSGDVLQLLWERQPDVEITDTTIMAAASTNSSTVMKLIELINSSPSQSPVYLGECLLEVLSGNRMCGVKALRLLLDRIADKGPISVTRQALINAAGNNGCGFELMSLLLDHGGLYLDIKITDEVMIAAAGNSLWGLEILALLVDRGYTLWSPTKVLSAAEENLWAGEEIVAFLLRYLLASDQSEGKYPVGDWYLYDDGSTFSGDTEVPEDTDVPRDKKVLEDMDSSSEESYETADDE